MTANSNRVKTILAAGGGRQAMNTGAVFSPDRKYRYRLWRNWDESSPTVAFIGLNPSTADETKDDPTIRRCINFAKAWGYGGMWMLNLFAFRATYPAEMLAEGLDAIGPDNDRHIEEVCKLAKLTVAVWGVHGTHLERAAYLSIFLVGSGVPLHCLGLTKGNGQPRHPLYLRNDTRPQPYAGAV